MALQITGSSNIVASVSAEGWLSINTPVSLTSITSGHGPGYAAALSENDPGTITAARYIQAPETDHDFRLRSSDDALTFFEPWSLALGNTGTINSGTWSLSTSSMTTSLAGAFCKLNSGASLSSPASAQITTLRSFSMYPTYQTYVEFQLQIQGTSFAINNTAWEIGFFLASGTSTPTDGVYLRMTSTGQLRLVYSFGGAEVSSANIPPTALKTFNSYDCVLALTPDAFELWIGNVLYAAVSAPAALPYFTSSSALPFSARIYNTGVPASATILLLGPVEVSYGGMHNSARFSDRVAMSEQGGYQTQSGNAAPSQTALWTNNAPPGLGTLNNASATYQFMGGEFYFAAIAGAETDYCLFGFLVPADATGAMNRNLLIRGVRIRTEAFGQAVSANGAVFQWGIAVGSSGVSLATAETTTTSSAIKGPRRKALGMQGFVGNSPVGAEAQLINCFFGDSPLFAEPGSYVQIIVRVVVGTAGGGSQFRGTVDIDAQYE